MYDLVTDLRARLRDAYPNDNLRRCVGYGHLGDSNLHLNLTSTKYDDRLFELIEPYVFEWTRKHRGSVSAEHGLGLKKRDYIGYSKSEALVGEMRKIKLMFDPRLIMNPYKTIPL